MPRTFACLPLCPIDLQLLLPWKLLAMIPLPGALLLPLILLSRRALQKYFCSGSGSNRGWPLDNRKKTRFVPCTLPLKPAKKRERTRDQLCAESRPRALTTGWTHKRAFHLLGNKIPCDVKSWERFPSSDPCGEWNKPEKHQPGSFSLIIYIC